MLTPERRKLIEASYSSMRPLIQELATRLFTPGMTMLDAGSGEGLLSIKMAEDFGASKLLLVDKISTPKVELPPHAEFHQMDILSPQFLQRFQNNIHLVTCINVFHEFDDPIQGAQQLISVLPERGVLVLIEHADLGWQYQKRLPEAVTKHCLEDFRRIRYNKFDTDAGIREFWESRCFPYMPGECRLEFMHHEYLVVYKARQWYEVKSPPECLRPQVDAYLNSHR